MVERLRYARLKSADLNWWRTELLREKNQEEDLLAVSCCFAWAQPKIIFALRPILGGMLDLLAKDNWHKIFARCALLSNGPVMPAAKLTDANFSALYTEKSCRFASLVLLRGRNVLRARAAARQVFRGRLDGDAKLVQQLSQLEFCEEQGIDWDMVSEISKTAKHACISWVPPIRPQQIEIPDHVAISVLEECDKHVASFVGACSRSLSSSVARGASKVSEKAQEQNWF